MPPPVGRNLYISPLDQLLLSRNQKPMKRKILAVVVIFFLAITMFSCKKMWQCTCTAHTPTGIQVDTFTINVKLYKISAEGDCYVDCKSLIFNSSDSDVTATVKAL